MKKKVIVLIGILMVLSLTIAIVLILWDNNDENCSALTLYDMEVSLDTECMIAKVTQRVEYYNNTGEELSHIVFLLYPYVYSEESPNLPVEDIHIAKTYFVGINYGGIIILRVNDRDNRLDFRVEDHLLYVNIDTLEPKDTVEIFIRYHVTLPEINHRMGYNNYTINLANFYPQAAVYENGEFRKDIYYNIGDPFYSDMANYNVKLIVPIDYTVASSGKLQREEANILTKTLYYKGENIRDYVIVLSDEYKVLDKRVNGIDVYYYYYKDNNPQKSLDIAINALTLFSEIIGEYPYDIFSVSETEFVFGGMEYSQLVMISSSLVGLDRERVIVHETAHQWWYNIVGNNSIDSAWMDEGLTEFTTLLYYKYNDNDLMADMLINQSLESYAQFDENRVDLGNNISSMDRSLGEFMTEYEYVMTVYHRGMLMFDSIYQIIGHDKFIAALKLYYEDYKFSIANDYELIQAFSKIGNAGLDKIFKAWLDGDVVIVLPNTFQKKIGANAPIL